MVSWDRKWKQNCCLYACIGILLYALLLLLCLIGGGFLVSYHLRCVVNMEIVVLAHFTIRTFFSPNKRLSPKIKSNCETSRTTMTRFCLADWIDQIRVFIWIFSLATLATQLIIIIFRTKIGWDFECDGNWAVWFVSNHCFVLLLLLMWYYFYIFFFS